MISHDLTSHPEINRLISRQRNLSPINRETNQSSSLVLASQSRSRSQILRRIGLRFTIDPSGIEEIGEKDKEPDSIAAELAASKAKRVSQRHPHSIIIGADTVIVDEKGLIGKPNDERQAKQMLHRLSGKPHIVLTGLAVIDSRTNMIIESVASTIVVFRKLTPSSIERYVQTGEPIGKAGGYALQGIGALLVERTEGDYTTVLGLPVSALVDALKQLGYEIL